MNSAEFFEELRKRQKKKTFAEAASTIKSAVNTAKTATGPKEITSSDFFAALDERRKYWRSSERSEFLPEYDQDLVDRHTKYSGNADWAQLGNGKYTAEDIQSDFSTAYGLAIGSVPDSWSEAQRKGISRLEYDEAQKQKQYLGQKYGIDLSGIDVDPEAINDLANNLNFISEFVPYMSEAEKAVLSYMFQTEGYDAALEWYEGRRFGYEDRKKNQVTAEKAEKGFLDPTGATLESFVGTILSPIENYADTLRYAGTGEKYYNMTAQGQKALRSGAMEATDWKIGDFDLHDFLYGTATSYADSRLLGLLGAPLGKAGQFAAFFSNAQAHTMNDALERGMSAEQAFSTGVAAGVFEGAFETISIGKLDALKEIPVATWRDVLKNMGKNGLVNLTEEAATEGANILYDFWANGEYSNFQRNYKTYLANGESKKEAWDHAFWDSVGQIAEAGASGLLMGVVGGTTGAGNLMMNKAQEKTQAANQQEKSVYDFVVNQEIANREKNGEKLSAREKRIIKQNALRNLSNGYIPTDTIEETLGGEAYEAYKKAVDEQGTLESREKSLSEEYTPLNRMQFMQMTGEQQDRRMELKEQLAEIQSKIKANKDNSTIQKLKAQLSQQVQQKVSGTRLAESYNEFARRSQAFTADLSKYDEKQRAVVQRAIDSGVLNNTNRSHELVDLIAKVSADKDVPFDFINNDKLKESGFALQDKTVNGYVDADGIKVNVQSHKALNAVVGHEITHVLEGTDLYDAMQNAVFAYAKSKGEYESRLKDITALCEGVKGADPVKELTADLIGDYLFTDAEFVNSLAVNNRNLFQKVYDEIKYLCRVVTAGSKEARQLEKVRKTFADAYRNTQAKTNTATDGGVRYSIRKDIVDVNGKEYDSIVELDKTVSKSVLSNPKRFLGYIEKNLVGAKIQVSDAYGNIEVIEFAKQNETVTKNGKRHPALGELAFAKGDVRKQVIVNAKEVIEESLHQPDSDSNENSHGWLDENGWETRNTYVLTQDGIIYEARLRIAKKRDGRNLLYAVNLNINDGVAVDMGATQKRAAVLAATPSSKTVPQESSGVNGKLSLSSNSTTQRSPGGIYGEDVALDTRPTMESWFQKHKQAREERTRQFYEYLNGGRSNRSSDLPQWFQDWLNGGKDRTAKETAGAEETAVARVLAGENEQAKEKGRFRSFLSSTMELVGDKGFVFENLSKKIKDRTLEAKWNFMRYSESMAQRFMEKGRKDSGVKSLQDIRKNVEQTGRTQQFFEYMYHRLNTDRMTLEDRYKGMKNKPVFGTQVTADVSQRMASQLERQNPRFAQMAQDVYDYMNYLRQLLVENSVISQETADLWAELYPHYVPIRRDGATDQAIHVPLDTFRTNVNAPVKNAKGGNQDILDMFNTIALRTEQTYKAASRYSFGLELKKALGVKAKQEGASVDEIIDSIDSQDLSLKAGENGKNPTFTVFENGEKVTFEITDDMYKALTPAGKVLSYTSKPINTISKVMRGAITEYNPWFMLTNAVKDVQDILLNSQHAAKTYAAIPRAVAQIAKGGKWYTEYMENGGEQNTYFDSRRKSFVKESDARKVANYFNPLHYISTANNFIERVPRLAEYIASRESGRSIEVSMLDAARVTTNFAAGGDLTKFFNRNGATFLNASVQGAMQQVRNIREAKMNGLKGWASLATKFLVAGLPAIALNFFIWGDDEEYEELPDHIKDNYYIVGKYGDGQFVRIPKGRAVSTIQAAFMGVSDMLTGDDEMDMDRFLELVVSNLAPNNPAENNVFSPIDQARKNTAWHGGEIVPERLQDLPEAEQYDETTDSISKWLGEKLNISPMKINYVLDQYTGVLGDTLLPMLTPAAESGEDSVLAKLFAPFKDKFTADAVFDNRNVSDFYDKMDELAENANSSAASTEDVLMYKYVSTKNDEISDLYKKEREIQNSDKADSEKYAELREVQEQINTLARESLANYDDIKMRSSPKNRYYAEVADVRFRWVQDADETEGYWRKITEKQAKRQDKVTSKLKITPDEYWSDRKEEFDYAYDYPEKYAVFKAVSDDFAEYQEYTSDLSNIHADKDANGKAINGSRKKKYAAYINGLDIGYGAKLILFKYEYRSDNSYNYEIVEYLNSRKDLSTKEIRTILEELDFDVDDDGRITWD